MADDFTSATPTPPRECADDCPCCFGDVAEARRQGASDARLRLGVQCACVGYVEGHRAQHAEHEPTLVDDLDLGPEAA